jgi:hypothetical protein
MVPTWAISLLVVVGLESFLSSSTTAVDGLVDAALEVHRVHAGGDGFMPSRTIAWASTVAVVVPSPATSEVLEATSAPSARPCSRTCPSSSISLATVTPSLVTRRGAEALLEHDVAALGAERDLDRVGEDVDAAQHAVRGRMGKYLWINRC